MRLINGDVLLVRLRIMEDSRCGLTVRLLEVDAPGPEGEKRGDMLATMRYVAAILC